MNESHFKACLRAFAFFFIIIHLHEYAITSLKITHSFFFFFCFFFGACEWCAQKLAFRHRNKFMKLHNCIQQPIRTQPMNNEMCKHSHTWHFMCFDVDSEHFLASTPCPRVYLTEFFFSLGDKIHFYSHTSKCLALQVLYSWFLHIKYSNENNYTTINNKYLMNVYCIYVCWVCVHMIDFFFTNSLQFWI